MPGKFRAFFDVPVDHLGSASIIARYINQKKEETDLGDIVVVSPDLGGVTRARDLADRVNAPIAIIEKEDPVRGCRSYEYYRRRRRQDLYYC